MPRGRYWYGPGFWKGSAWQPGQGGFEGGYNPRPGRGPGHGYCRWWATPGSLAVVPASSGPAEEKAFLKEQVSLLEDELSALRERISELGEE